VFSDTYGPDDRAARSEADRALLRAAAETPGGPLVVVQHSPIHPLIEADYPYMLANRREVMADYSAAGVLLSISGHYHAGRPMTSAGGVLYYTAAALGEPPFRYSIATLRGRDVAVEERTLALNEPFGVWDMHVHTELSYCGRGVSAGQAVERAGTFGLAGLCLIEHAPQLYCRQEVFWSGRHVVEPRLWREPACSRMEDFRRLVEPFRGPSVRVGLEVEPDADGELTVHEADRRWVDVLIGAIHFLPQPAEDLDDEALTELVMWLNERILAGGVDVLAHPWRIFRMLGRPVPTGRYGQLAEMLAETNTAAEINLHKGSTDPAFIAECVRRGVKISLGSDAHETWQVGLLGAHVELLRRAAAAPDVGGLLLSG
ncbi:MAG: hypothetical protein J7M21_02625, partial [Planctomycetes bacterium]|nr:hypothetical protein [Planctomycetota bacterium]